MFIGIITLSTHNIHLTNLDTASFVKCFIHCRKDVYFRQLSRYSEIHGNLYFILGLFGCVLDGMNGNVAHGVNQFLQQPKSLAKNNKT